MIIVRVTDYEWWIGPSVQACVDAYKAQVSSDPDEEFDETEDAVEVSDVALDRLVIVVEGDQGERSTKRLTYREQLQRELDAGGEFPRLFASSEW